MQLVSYLVRFLIVCCIVFSLNFYLASMPFRLACKKGTNLLLVWPGRKVRSPHKLLADFVRSYFELEMRHDIKIRVTQ
jgi:hypothetical protein